MGVTSITFESSSYLHPSDLELGIKYHVSALYPLASLLTHLQPYTGSNTFCSTLPSLENLSLFVDIVPNLSIGLHIRFFI